MDKNNLKATRNQLDQNCLIGERARKLVAGVAAAIAALALSACGPDGEPTSTPSNTPTLEQTVDPTTTSTPEVSPTAGEKSWETIIDDIDPADYVITADDSLTADQIAKELIDRQDKIAEIFVNDEGLSVENNWYDEEFNGGNLNPDILQFERPDEKMTDKLHDTYYAKSVLVDTEADTGGLEDVATMGAAWYSGYSAGSVDNIAFKVDTTIEDTSTKKLDDGTYIVKVKVYTQSNANEINPDAGYKKTENYTFHLIDENGEVRVISLTRDVLS